MARSNSSVNLVAQWLVDEVGEGGIFTKQALRAALPQFEQVDRRMRDLRAYGWRIDTYLEDAELKSGQLRLVYAGPRPGEPGFKAPTVERVSAKERLAAISAADFRCSQCGTQLGEPDGSDAGFAQLRVLRVDDGLIVACALCAKAAPSRARDDSALLVARLERLSPDELREFRARIEGGHVATAVESAMILAARVPRETALRCASVASGSLNSA